MVEGEEEGEGEHPWARNRYKNHATNFFFFFFFSFHLTPFLSPSLSFSILGLTTHSDNETLIICNLGPSCGFTRSEKRPFFQLP